MNMQCEGEAQKEQFEKKENIKQMDDMVVKCDGQKIVR